MLLPPPITAAHQVDATLRERGHAVVDAAALHEQLGVPAHALDAWWPYWGRLAPDTHPLDDARVIHESTPIQPLDSALAGHRDTLVLTLRAGGFQDPGPDRYSIARLKSNP